MARMLDAAVERLAAQHAAALAAAEARLVQLLQHERLLVQKLLAGVTSTGVDAAMLRVMPFYLVNDDVPGGGAAAEPGHGAGAELLEGDAPSDSERDSRSASVSPSVVRDGIRQGSS